MKDQNCAYCMEGELVAAFGIKICELETSKVYLFKEQSHPGRCIVAHILIPNLATRSPSTQYAQF